MTPQVDCTAQIFAREERVSFANDRGETLLGVLHVPAPGDPSIGAVLCHGMESSKESEKLVALSRALAQRGISTLRFDFSYVGESGSKFADLTYSGEVADLKAACQFMLGRQVKKLAILGSSMGGTVGLLFAAERTDVAALVTVAAPLHPERFAEKMLTREERVQWRQSGFITYHGRRLNVSLLDDLEKINVPRAVEKLSCPLLVIHGDKDEVVGVHEAYELYELAPGEKSICILRGADHRLSDPSLLNKAMRSAAGWMSQHLE